MNTATDHQPTELESALAALPPEAIKYEATFIPFSKSRNAKEKTLSLNWGIRINGELFEYMAGIGHISNEAVRKAAMKSGWTIYEKAAVEAWVEGRQASPSGSIFPKQITPQTPPALADVLSCLIMDSGAIDEKFEDWASNYGYDADSRKAEKTYNECRENALKLIRAIGAATLEKLKGLEH